MSQYPQPQFVKQWKEDKENQLKELAINIHGKLYVKYDSAKIHGRSMFTKGFKVARRDRTALTDHMINAMKEHFDIKLKGITNE